MSKIENINPIYNTGKKAIKSKIKTGIQKLAPTQPERTQNELVSFLDLSMEELGFFKCGNKIVPIKFPR